MNQQSIPMAFGLIVALALGSVACSQHPGNEGGTPMGPGAATTAPVPPGSATDQPPPMPAPMTGSAQPGAGTTAGGAGTGTDFNVLAGSKGYVTRDDAQRDPWLQAHFAECGANRDGRVDRNEYAACHGPRSQGSGAPIGGAASGGP